MVLWQSIKMDCTTMVRCDVGESFLFFPQKLLAKIGANRSHGLEGVEKSTFFIFGNFVNGILLRKFVAYIIQ